VTRLYRLTLVSTLGLLVFLTIVLMELPDSIWNRVLNPDAYRLHNATNLSWRFELWAAAFRLGTENWLTGIGVGNRTAIIQFLDPTRFEATWIMAHNEYLQVFYELGVFGLAVFLAFLVTLSQQTLRTAARLRDLGQEDQRWFVVAAGLSLFIGMIFSLQVDAFHFPLKGWWLAAGLVLVADRLSRADAARVASPPAPIIAFPVKPETPR
jgi:O-antigen ligase